MSNKSEMKKVYFGLAPRTIIGIVLIAVIITVASVMVGSNIYWNDIVVHYGNVAKHTAKAVENVFEKEELAAWGDVAYRYSYGNATDEEVSAIVESDRYKELKHLTENLNISNETNDIYIVLFDVDVADAYTPELDADKKWNPFIYIMDTYYISEEQYPLGSASSIDVNYTQMLRNCWVTGENTNETAITYWMKGGLYILSGFTTVVHNGKTIAIIGVEMPLPTLEADYNNFMLKIIMVDMIAMVIILAIAITFITFNIVRPIKTLANEAMSFVADNSTVSDKLGKIKTHDEIQLLSESLLSLENGVIDYINNLTAITAEKERFTAELGVATKIQEDMMPTEFPQHADFDLYATMTPAKDVGGDFYDFFFIDDDHLGLVMADVSGKGVPAALFMAITKTVLRNSAINGRTPSKSLELTSNIMCQGNRAAFFVTAWLGILTLSTGELVYANAGHEYPALKRKNEKYKLLPSDNYPPLAADENLEYIDEKLTLEAGDSLFLYTDGIPEAKSGDGSRFGTERMIEVLNRNKDAAPKELLTAVKSAVDSFVGDNDPFDDVTMMSVVWNGSRK